MKLYVLPAFLEIGEWDELDNQLKKDFPFQFFVRRTIPRTYSRYLSWPINRFYWRLNHRFNPRHQYNILKPRSLRTGYHDPRDQIEAAAFDTLSVYAEKSLMGDGVDGTKWKQSDFDYYEDNDPDHYGREHFYEQVKREKQIIELRNWWVIDRKNREIMVFDPPEGRPEWGDSWVLRSKYRDTPEYQAYRKYSDAWSEMEEQWTKEDNRKFHELVDLLPYLWY